MDKNPHIQTLTVNTARLLAADMVQAANSGHPGIALGAAPIAYSVFCGMKINGENPRWADRDRFVLSAGHGSSILYALLHLFGFDLTLEDLQSFRQLESKTDGHPDYNNTPGVDVSTGPLGQGVANAVGMALAERSLAAKFNRPGYEIVNHYTYAICGDGCMMQGISNEAASFAGHQGLGKLILLYDSNDISIEGKTGITFTENVMGRFEALGWHVQRVDDGDKDMEGIAKAIETAKAVKDKPSLIEVKTTIGYGAPTKAGTEKSHGEALGSEELAGTKRFFGFDPSVFFHVPEEVKAHMADIRERNRAKEEAWKELIGKYEQAHPDLAEEWEKWHSLYVPQDVYSGEFWANIGDEEPRGSSHRILNHVSKFLPNLIGGSADLGPSNRSIMAGREYLSRENPEGTNIHFGAREFAMTAIANGMAVHGGLRPYVAEFLVFSDYMKAALRMSAIMKTPLIAILTHDSIGVGEDGPTHHPVEQLAALRSMPGMTVIRPADASETAAAWQIALSRKEGPTALILSKQKTKFLGLSPQDALRGGYIVRDTAGPPDIILMATGSEMAITLEAAETLEKSHSIKARVVSLPSFEVFEEQSEEYKESVLPKSITKRLAVEAACSFGWHKYVGLEGDVLAMDAFGKSGKAEVLFRHFGFTAGNVVYRALGVLG